MEDNTQSQNFPIDNPEETENEISETAFPPGMTIFPEMLAHTRRLSSDDFRRYIECCLEYTIQGTERATKASILGKKYADASFETAKLTPDNKYAYEKAEAYCDDFLKYARGERDLPQKSLYIAGNYGTGKTHSLERCLKSSTAATMTIFPRFIHPTTASQTPATG